MLCYAILHCHINPPYGTILYQIILYTAVLYYPIYILLRSCQKCETAVELELQEAEICDCFASLQVSFKTGTVLTQHFNG